MGHQSWIHHRLDWYPDSTRWSFQIEKRSAQKIWQWSPYGLSIPYVRNSMRQDAFEFLRRHIHFAENDQRKNEGEPAYDLLFKL